MIKFSTCSLLSLFGHQRDVCRQDIVYSLLKSAPPLWAAYISSELLFVSDVSDFSNVAGVSDVSSV